VRKIRYWLPFGGWNLHIFWQFLVNFVEFLTPEPENECSPVLKINYKPNLFTLLTYSSDGKKYFAIFKETHRNIDYWIERYFY